MNQQEETAGRIFSALAHAHINVKMIDQGSSELNIIIESDMMILKCDPVQYMKFLSLPVI